MSTDASTLAHVKSFNITDEDLRRAQSEIEMAAIEQRNKMVDYVREANHSSAKRAVELHDGYQRVVALLKSFDSANQPQPEK